MIYVAELTDMDGKTKRHPGRPSSKFLRKNPQFVEYYESGFYNEHHYRTRYKIENARLIEISDWEKHSREIDIIGF